MNERVTHLERALDQFFPLAYKVAFRGEIRQQTNTVKLFVPTGSLGPVFLTGETFPGSPGMQSIIGNPGSGSGGRDGVQVEITFASPVSGNFEATFYLAQADAVRGLTAELVSAPAR